MLLGAEAEGQQLCHGFGFEALFVHHVDQKTIIAELPHDLPAHAAGRKTAGNNAILAAADGNGSKIPVTVIDCLENCGAFRAVGGSVGGVFNVAALIHRAIFAQQRRAYLVAGIGHICVLHGLLGQLHQFLSRHKISSCYHTFTAGTHHAPTVSVVARL